MSWLLLPTVLLPRILLADAPEPRTVPVAAVGSETLWMEPGERARLEIEVAEPGLLGVSLLAEGGNRDEGWITGIGIDATGRLVERSLRHLLAEVAPGRLALELRFPPRAPAGAEVRVESHFAPADPEGFLPAASPLKNGSGEDDDEIEIEPDPFQNPGGGDPWRTARALQKTGGGGGGGGGGEDDDEIEIEPDPIQNPAGSPPSGALARAFLGAFEKNGGGGGGGGGGEDDDEIEIEPDPIQNPAGGDPGGREAGDSFLLAEPLLLGRWVSGSVGGPGGDVDVFRIRLPRRHRAQTWSLVALGADASLYDARGHRLALDEAMGSGAETGTEATLLAGEYFLVLHGPGPRSRP
ncbi:MAG: hypothetical protein MI919_28400, partial [Holophagales bacterium]|nr:hypothetical protein [Holophagales bacterium]